MRTIFAPHTSAGRLPTELGLRRLSTAVSMGNPSREDRNSIEAMSAGAGRSMDQVSEATSALAGLTQSVRSLSHPRLRPAFATLNLYRCLLARLWLSWCLMVARLKTG